MNPKEQILSKFCGKYNPECLTRIHLFHLERELWLGWFALHMADQFDSQALQMFQCFAAFIKITKEPLKKKLQLVVLRGKFVVSFSFKKKSVSKENTRRLRYIPYILLIIPIQPPSPHVVPTTALVGRRAQN